MGAGPGAHGQITLGGVRQATHAASKPADYIARVAGTGLGFATREPLTPREAAEERLLSGMRITEGVPLADVAALSIEPQRIVRTSWRSACCTRISLRLRPTPSGPAGAGPPDLRPGALT